MRVRFGTNDPTPWPPELPAGENPLPGAIIDYVLPQNASQPVKLEILDNAGKVVRRYASTDPVLDPHPALNPEAYNQICMRQPSATDCGLPLYWPAPPIRLSSRPGFHRFSWDMRFEPIGAEEDPVGGDEGATGAVPHRTYPTSFAPWAPPGSYTVRLTADGKTYTQPLTLRLDPRVKTPATALAQLASLSRETYDAAWAAHAAYEQARALSAQLDKTTGDDVAAFKRQVDSLAPPRAAGGRGGRGGGGARTRRRWSRAPTLETAPNAMMSAAMAMQGADVAPTAGQVAAITKARADGADAMRRWNTLQDVRPRRAQRKAESGRTAGHYPSG